MYHVKLKRKLARFPRSPVWDKITQSIVDGVRAYIHREPQPTISYIQKASAREKSLESSFYSVQDTLSAPAEDDIRQVLFQAINELGPAEYEPPSLIAVPIEWIRKRREKEDTPTLPTSLQENVHDHVHNDVKSHLTIFHVHGGAYFQGSPEAYRRTTSQLADLSGGRVVSVKYRLSPQHTFPAAILDVLFAYLSLLYPSSDSTHRPVDPSHVVFAGDSVGGVLLFALIQILLHTKSYSPIRFHSQTVTFPIARPAGIAILSLPGELLYSLPSFSRNMVHDLFFDIPWAMRDYPTCPIWPTNPPRGDIYCPYSSFRHPLVSLALTKSWEGAPPIWLASGEEQFVDGGKAVARRAAQQGVNVTWTQYQAMPHCFPTIPGLDRSKQATMVMNEWANFCRECVGDDSSLSPGVKAFEVTFGDVLKHATELESTNDLPLSEVEERIEHRIKILEDSFHEQWMDRTFCKL